MLGAQAPEERVGTKNSAKNPSRIRQADCAIVILQATDRKAGDTMRLFCFHHAGGGGLAFKAWNRALKPAFEVIPVEIANRERFGTLRHLVDEVNDQLRSSLDEPHMFFGHSFGALLAYRLACARAAEDSPLPRAIFLSAYAPPHLPPPLHAVDLLDDQQLATFLSASGRDACGTDALANSARARRHGRQARPAALLDR